MMRLHDYWRSSAACRVRIALNLKGIAYTQVLHDLRIGAQGSAGYAALNPQRVLSALETDGAVLTQSIGILEWLEETHPAPPPPPPPSEPLAAGLSGKRTTDRRLEPALDPRGLLCRSLSARRAPARPTVG